MYRLLTDRAVTSSAFTSGIPPPRSVDNVRAICAVVNLRTVGPTQGIASTPRSKRARCPGWRTHAAKAAPAMAAAATIRPNSACITFDTPTMMRVDMGSSALKLA